MKYIEVQQGGDEWLTTRAGKITASRAKDACDRIKGGALSVKAENYAAQVAMERVAGTACDDTFVNFAMKRGAELEPAARTAYEMATGDIAQEAGIYLTDDEVFAYSSDGLVGEVGLIEIKCPLSPSVVVGMWRTGMIDDYLHQIQMGLWLTGRKWLDFVMYDPRLALVGKELYIHRVERDEGFIESMEARLVQFLRVVESYEAVLRGTAQPEKKAA